VAMASGNPDKEPSVEMALSEGRETFLTLLRSPMPSPGGIEVQGAVVRQQGDTTFIVLDDIAPPACFSEAEWQVIVGALRYTAKDGDLPSSKILVALADSIEAGADGPGTVLTFDSVELRAAIAPAEARRAAA
jgi:hypothetical protein